MSYQPFSQWMALGRSSIATFKELGAAAAGLKEAAPSQAQLAQLVKSALELRSELAELQANACVHLMQAQLGGFDAAPGAKAMQQLADVQFDLANSMCSHWKEALEHVAARSNACVDGLRKAQTAEDVSFVAAAFAREVGDRLRKDVEESGKILNGATAAATVLAHRALDEVIEAGAGQAGA
jgi:hypothetical protein